MTCGIGKPFSPTSRLTPAQMDARGWRLPLLVGCLITPFLFLIRRSLTETEEFLSRKRYFSTRDILRSLADNWRVVGLATMLVAMSTSSFYLITAYTPTFGRSVLHLADVGKSDCTVCAGASNSLWLP
jgi:hypothetical protein